MSQCKSCGADFLWATSRSSGKAMPLDLASKEMRVVIIKGKGVVMETYVSHFATCPHAKGWKKS